jgi:hypothetical protein
VPFGAMMPLTVLLQLLADAMGWSRTDIATVAARREPRSAGHPDSDWKHPGRAPYGVVVERDRDDARALVQRPALLALARATVCLARRARRVRDVEGEHHVGAADDLWRAPLVSSA